MIKKFYFEFDLEDKEYVHSVLDNGIVKQLESEDFEDETKDAINRLLKLEAKRLAAVEKGDIRLGGLIAAEEIKIMNDFPGYSIGIINYNVPEYEAEKNGIRTSLELFRPSQRYTVREMVTSKMDPDMFNMVAAETLDYIIHLETKRISALEEKNQDDARIYQKGIDDLAASLPGYELKIEHAEVKK